MFQKTMACALSRELACLYLLTITGVCKTMVYLLTLENVSLSRACTRKTDAASVQLLGLSRKFGAKAAHIVLFVTRGCGILLVVHELNFYKPVHHCATVGTTFLRSLKG